MPARLKPIEWIENANGCWICTSHKLNTSGYPAKLINGKASSLSRFIWAQSFGEIPAGMCVCHRCDTPACIRLDHLFLGTHTDNMRDMISKGRYNRKGENNGRCKLAQGDAQKIRVDMRAAIMIAHDYGISQTQVFRIKHNMAWKTSDHNSSSFLQD